MTIPAGPQHFLKKKLVVVTTDGCVSKKLRPLGVLAVLHCCSVADSIQSDRQPEAGVVWLEFKPFSVEQRGRVVAPGALINWMTKVTKVLQASSTSFLVLNLFQSFCEAHLGVLCETESRQLRSVRRAT
jgi:hypothetical protein